MKKMQWSMMSKAGRLYLVASEKGLEGIFWKKQGRSIARSLDAKTPEAQILSQAARQLGEYFLGKRRIFDVPLDIKGTTFQKKVWNELRKIPYGKTVSYKDIARGIQNEKAVRAVGSANGKNPLCVIVPCHRVIAHDGTLGGYSGGIEKKKKLLKLECARQELNLQPSDP